MRYRIFAACLAAVGVAPAWAENGAEDAPDGDAIIVTGQKLAQTLKDTPNSVLVATGADFDRPNYRDADDLLKGMPNIVFNGEDILPVVRGIDGNGVANGGYGAVSGGRPRITSYVDGVPRSYTFRPNGVPTGWDAAQLEFYRGAQSTALGRNAIAGALVVNSKDPVDRVEGAAQLGIRSGDISYGAAAMLNLPLVEDRLALRVTADGYAGENYVDYDGPLRTANAKLSRDDGYRLRAKLAWRPRGFDDETSIRLMVERQYTAAGWSLDIVDADRARRYRMSGNVDAIRLKTDLVSLEARIPLGRSWSLYGIASYQKARESIIPPFDGDARFLDVTADSTEYTQEVRISHAPADSRLRFVAGLFHFSRDRDELGFGSFAYTATDKGSTFAAFADAVIPIGPFDVLAGGRWERERQDRDFRATLFGFGLRFDEAQKIFLPKAGLRWNLGDAHRLTALYYRGYSPAAAGVSFISFTPYVFRRERSDTIELAWRSELDGRRLTIGANLFATRYKDQQLAGTGPFGPFDGVIVNADKTRYLGGELEFGWQPSRALSINAALGLLDSKIIRFGTPANDVNNGNQLAHAPHVTARLAVRGEVLPGLSLEADARYTGRHYSNYINLAADRIGDRLLVDLRAQYRMGPTTVFLYAENVFDRFYYLQRDTRANYATAGRPRTIGAAIRANF